MSSMTLVDEFKNNNQWISDNQTFVPSTYAESIDMARSDVIVDLQRAKDRLQNLDDRILELVLEREHTIAELEATGNQALGGWLCTADALEMIANAYARLGWKSKLACALVKHLRRLFFDDDQKVFMDIVCYGIENNHMCYADTSVMRSVNVTFGPKKHNITRAFQIQLVGRGGMKFEWKHCYIETDIKVWKMTGDESDHYLRKPLIARSAKLSDIREAICRFVKSGEHESFKLGSPERNRLEMIIDGLMSGVTRQKLSERMLAESFSLHHKKVDAVH